MLYRNPEADTVSPVAVARAVREAVAAMRQALAGSAGNRVPEMVDTYNRIENCMPGLERSVQLLRELSPLAERDREHLRRELAALRTELANATHLAHTGSAFFQGLARLLGVASGGYTPAGEGAPLEAAGTLLLRG